MQYLEGKKCIIQNYDQKYELKSFNPTLMQGQLHFLATGHYQSPYIQGRQDKFDTFAKKILQVIKSLILYQIKKFQKYVVCIDVGFRFTRSKIPQQPLPSLAWSWTWRRWGWPAPWETCWTRWWCGSSIQPGCYRQTCWCPFQLRPTGKSRRDCSPRS